MHTWEVKTVRELRMSAIGDKVEERRENARQKSFLLDPKYALMEEDGAGDDDIPRRGGHQNLAGSKVGLARLGRLCLCGTNRSGNFQPRVTCKAPQIFPCESFCSCSSFRAYIDCVYF